MTTVNLDKFFKEYEEDTYNWYHSGYMYEAFNMGVPLIEYVLSHEEWDGLTI